VYLILTKLQHNYGNPLFFIIRPLVDLIKGRNVRVQVKAANALEAMATNNVKCQKAFLELDAPKVLLKLLKVIYRTQLHLER